MTSIFGNKNADNKCDYAGAFINIHLFSYPPRKAKKHPYLRLYHYEALFGMACILVADILLSIDNTGRNLSKAKFMKVSYGHNGSHETLL